MRETITTSHGSQTTTLPVAVTLKGHSGHSCLQLGF